MSNGESVSEQKSPGPLFLLSSFPASSFPPSLPSLLPSFLLPLPPPSLLPSFSPSFLASSFLPITPHPANLVPEIQVRCDWPQPTPWSEQVTDSSFVPGGERFSLPLLMSWEAFIPVWGLIGRLCSLQLLALGDRLLPGLVRAFHCRPSGESLQMCGLEHHQPERSSRRPFERPQLYSTCSRCSLY